MKALLKKDWNKNLKERDKINFDSKMILSKGLKIGALAALSIGLFGCGQKALVLKEEAMTIEYGTPISMDIASYLNSEKLDKEELSKILAETKLEIVDDNKVENKDYQAKGDYTVKLTYEKEEAEVKVSVKDTTKPQFVKDTKKEVSFTKDCKPTAEDFSKMFKAEDLDTVKITVDDSKVDYAKEGTYQATVKAVDASQNESTQTVTVKITKPELKLDVSKKSMYVKESFVLKPTVKGKDKKATFKSSNTNIATVSETGKVTAKKKGTTTITVSANGVSATCKVTVKSVPEGSSTTTQTIKNPTTGKNETVTVVKPSKPSSNTTNGKAVLSREALTYVNQVRAEKGRAPIKWASEFEWLALERAKQISTDFSHNNSGADRGISGVAENIAQMNSSNTAKAAVNAWKNSPMHNASMISSDNTGVVVARYGNYWVAIFTY